MAIVCLFDSATWYLDKCYRRRNHPIHSLTEAGEKLAYMLHVCCHDNMCPCIPSTNPNQAGRCQLGGVGNIPGNLERELRRTCY